MHVLLVLHVGRTGRCAPHQAEKGGGGGADPADGQRSSGQAVEGGTGVAASLQRLISGIYLQNIFWVIHASIKVVSEEIRGTVCDLEKTLLLNFSNILALIILFIGSHDPLS